ncbi:hypothetical protein [Nitrosophilus kaiyonis]|uniref:hypothetical protein n=1 Tax=Nitrosophilus kaiyonis TaxID=2930200 RepID=UPI002490590B|nr:hypothetical protein [Nitrosophilus kaiyonis]
MAKIFYLFLTISFLFADISFEKLKCQVIKPGGSTIVDKNHLCLVIDKSKNFIYWVKIKALPFITGDPYINTHFSNNPRSINYVGCDTYENFEKSDTCKMCKESFWDTEIKVGQELWYLVVGNDHSDFCYINGGAPLQVETYIVKKHDDAGSKRDSSFKNPVIINVNRIYHGMSAGDEDWYLINLPTDKVIKFFIKYTKGPSGNRKLKYRIIPEDPVANLPIYCTDDHKTIKAQYGGGSKAWYSIFFPDVGESAYCYLKFKKEKNHSNTKLIYFIVEPPLQYPPPDEEGKPKDSYKLPEYEFSFEIINDQK